MTRFDVGKRLSLTSPLRRVAYWPLEPPAPGYVPRSYVWLTQVHMWSRILLDTMELPQETPDVREMVLARAERFFEFPAGREPQLRRSWQRRLPPMYVEALSDLLVLVCEWLAMPV